MPVNVYVLVNLPLVAVSSVLMTLTLSGHVCAGFIDL